MNKRTQIFFNLETYNMNPLIPSIDNIISFDEILSIGGGLLFFPFRNDSIESYKKNPSVFIGNNNSIYIDDYIPDVPIASYKTWIPEQFDFVSYLKLYVTFRTIYKTSGYDDHFDILLIVLKDSLQNYKNKNDAGVKGKLTEWLLWLVDSFQRILAINSIHIIEDYKKKAKESITFINNNESLKKERNDSLDRIFNSYSTLYRRWLLEQGKDLVSGWSSNLPKGKSMFNQVQGLTLIDGRFLKLFYETMIQIWRYVSVPMPIHIPKTGWCYGYDTEVTFRLNEKSSNIINVDASFVKREVARSTFVVISTKTSDINISDPKITEVKNKKTCANKDASSKYIKMAESKGISGITEAKIESTCNILSDNDPTAHATFNNLLSSTKAEDFVAGNSKESFFNPSNKFANNISNGVKDKDVLNAGLKNSYNNLKSLQIQRKDTIASNTDLLKRGITIKR